MKTESINNLLDQESQWLPSEAGAWQKQVPTDTSRIVRWGGLFVFGFFILFLLWATLFPIASAVVASGKVVSAGQNKLIQHPTGGVVQDILVEDGAFVDTGTVLLLLDPSGSQAELTKLLAQKSMLTALKGRLEAEASGAEFGNTVSVSGLKLRGPQHTAAMEGESVINSRILVEQQIEFDAGRKRLNAELDAANHQIESLKDQKDGFETQLDSVRQLLEITKMELAKVEPLVEEGYLAKSRLWDLDKTRLDQISQIGNLESEIDATEQKILEAQAKLAQLKEADREKRSEELTSVITELEQIKDQISAAQSSVNLTELRAPESGTIVKMAAHTNGGVIRGGEVIAEIVPQNSGLETEFRILPADINSVSEGQDARIIITAFNRRTYDPIEGVVSYVSADSAVDEMTGETYFLARARLIHDPDKHQGFHEIQAGMATEVYAQAGPRVFMSYALQPLFDSMGRSFKETN
ncbi:MAG: HlyD family type I secretion periplasmic adaptor subunit [Rhizobiaceae bacterium]